MDEVVVVAVVGVVERMLGATLAVEGVVFDSLVHKPLFVSFNSFLCVQLILIVRILSVYVTHVCVCLCVNDPGL